MVDSDAKAAEARYLAAESLPLSQCTARRKADAQASGSLKSRDFEVCGPGGAVVAEDYSLPEICYLERAWEAISTVEGATVKELRTLRQAIRECWAQGMPLDLPSANVSKKELSQFLKTARLFDGAHHGEVTF